MIRSPELTMSLGFDYRKLTSSGLWGLNVSGYHSSEYETQLGSENTSDAFTTLGAVASFSPGNGPLTLKVFGRNLTNESYVTGTVVSTTAYRSYYAPPREIGVSANYKF